MALTMPQGHQTIHGERGEGEDVTEHHHEEISDLRREKITGQGSQSTRIPAENQAPQSKQRGTVREIDGHYCIPKEWCILVDEQNIPITGIGTKTPTTMKLFNLPLMWIDVTTKRTSTTTETINLNNGAGI